jgi:hypothetical protein
MQSLIILLLGLAAGITAMYGLGGTIGWTSPFRALEGTTHAEITVCASRRFMDYRWQLFATICGLIAIGATLGSVVLSTPIDPVLAGALLTSVRTLAFITVELGAGIALGALFVAFSLLRSSDEFAALLLIDAVVMGRRTNAVAAAVIAEREHPGLAHAIRRVSEIRKKSDAREAKVAAQIAITIEAGRRRAVA